MTELEKAVRGIMVGIAGGLIGMTALIFVAYAQKAYKQPHTILPWHVTLIAFSYMCLVVVTGIDMVIRLINSVSLLWWRVGLLTIAYVTGIIALIAIIKLIARRPHHPPHPLTRGTDRPTRGDIDSDRGRERRRES